MTIKNIRQDDDCTNVESGLAQLILDRTFDHLDDLPEGIRVAVIVASGEAKGRIGCATIGYDEDERLMLDLQFVGQAVDLGAKPT